MQQHMQQHESLQAHIQHVPVPSQTPVGITSELQLVPVAKGVYMQIAAPFTTEQLPIQHV